MHPQDFPFQEVALGNNEFIRLFYANLDTSELIWHWDREDRDIQVLQAGGWKYEEEGLKVKALKDGEQFFIPQGKWHRVLKGGGDLIIKVVKHI